MSTSLNSNPFSLISTPSLSIKVGEIWNKAENERDEEDEASIEKQHSKGGQQREPSRVKQSQPSLTSRSAIRPISKIRSALEASQHELMCSALVRDRGRGRYCGTVSEGKIGKTIDTYR